MNLDGLRTATKRLADGSRRVYAYLHGLPVANGSGLTLEAANADLAQALAQPAVLARIAAIREKPKRPAPSRHYLGGVVEAFLGSEEWTAIDERTRREYRRYLDAFRDSFRDYKLTLFDDPAIIDDIIEWRDGHWSGKPRAADYAMQSVSRLFKFARGRGWTKADPTRDIERLSKTNRSDVIWTEGDLARFKAAATPAVWRVVALAAETGMRQGDLLALTWASVGRHSIARRTNKRGTIAVVPLRPAAAELVGSIPRTSTHVLLTTKGKPWLSGFGASFNRARAKAGLQHLRFHDLRGTAATRLCEVLSEEDLARVLGWSTERVRDMLALYVSADVIAQRMLDRLENSGGAANRLQTGAVSSIADGRKA